MSFPKYKVDKGMKIIEVEVNGKVRIDINGMSKDETEAEAEVEAEAEGAIKVGMIIR